MKKVKTKSFALLIALVALLALSLLSHRGPQFGFSKFSSTTQDNDALVLPQSFQVFQRDSETAGFLPVNLYLKVAPPQTVVIRITDPQVSRLPDKTETLNLPQGSLYKTEVRLPAGGWYSIDVEQTDTQGNGFHSTVGYFGIGDVFVTAGQSNATSAGEVLTRTNTTMVSAYVFDLNTNPALDALRGPGHWQLNNDPQPPEGLPTEEEARARGYSRENFGSVWPTMGDALYGKFKVPIATAETGVGGTSIAEWQKGYPGGPYKRFMETVRLLVKTTGVRMILWDQGESDNSEAQANPPEIYGDKFKKLQADLTRDVGKKIPWMMATASFAPVNNHDDLTPCDSLSVEQATGQVHSIRTAQQKLIAEGAAFAGPDTDQFVGAGNRYPNKRGQCIHFGYNGQIGVGLKWAEKIGIMKIPLTGFLSTPSLKCRGRTCYCNLDTSRDGMAFCSEVNFHWEVSDPTLTARVYVDGNPDYFLTGQRYGDGSADWIAGRLYKFTLKVGDQVLDSMNVMGTKKVIPK